MRFIPDEPLSAAAGDKLGFAGFVDLIQSSIAHTKTPFVYGVLGDWGTGKTSILKILEERFEEGLREKQVPYLVPIWFNAWKYENETNIIYPLLHAVKRSYEKRTQNPDSEATSFGKKFRQVVATSAFVLGDIGFRGATKMVSGTAYSLGDLEKYYKLVTEQDGQQSELEKIMGEWTDSVEKLNAAFRDLLDIYARDLATKAQLESDVQFVILIDDLDRCLPETTIALLESIKNYLAVERCVYVLGLNPRIVYLGIRHKYKGLAIDGREYLEKILNYTFYVPEPKPEEIAAFAEERLKELVVDGALEQIATYARELGRVLRDTGFSNPRKIKRILNRYLLFLSRYGSKYDEYALPNIIRLLVIAEYFPNLFQLFLGTDTKKVLDSVTHFGEGAFNISGFQSDFGVDIASMYPQLVRMRTLFHLTIETNVNKPKLREQALDVFSLTRLV